MKRLTLLVLFSAVTLPIATIVHAQVKLQPTPPPLVTAENEPWYANAEPIFFAGNLYDPSGAKTHFNGNEMVLSGLHRSIPMYIRPTVEPNRVLYVPLSGGLMQPYERRRTDIAGKVGSSTPSFPILPSEPSAGVSPQAAAPAAVIAAAIPAAPVVVTAPPVRPAPARVVAREAVGTSGLMAAPRRPATTAVRPTGLNGVFVEFNDVRWFSSGPATAFDPALYTRVGQHHGFPVYTRKDGAGATIYIPMILDKTDFVAPYSRRRPR